MPKNRILNINQIKSVLLSKLSKSSADYESWINCFKSIWNVNISKITLADL